MTMYLNLSLDKFIYLEGLVMVCAEHIEGYINKHNIKYNICCLFDSERSVNVSVLISLTLISLPPPPHFFPRQITNEAINLDIASD